MRRLRGASVKDSGTSAETREFSNLMCGSERVTIIDVDKPRVSLVGADCEKFCRRWTIGNFVSDNGVFVVKDENHKTQRTLLFVHEKCDECEGTFDVSHTEESLIKNSCSETWRGAESKFVQPRILATKTDHQGKKQGLFREEEGFDFRKAAIRQLISPELRHFFPDSVVVHPLDVCVLSVGYFPQKSTEGSQSAQAIGQPCVQRDSRTVENEK